MDTTSDNTPINHALEELYSTDQLIQRVYPRSSGTGSLIEALKEVKKETLLKKLLDHTRLLETKIPVLAVVGGLNAGKSSVVSSFLSAQGESRVLKGMLNDQGTQRFVIWCPSSWKEDNNLYSSLQKILVEVFESKIESLSEDPEEAHIQYNQGYANESEKATSLFSIPLIAFDDGLNQGGFAILDCPDVERSYPGATSEEETAHLRLEVVERAAKIATGILAVIAQSQSGQEDFRINVSRILKQMPGVEWWLLINRVDTEYPPHKVYQDNQEIISKKGNQGTYLAYDFKQGEHWKKYTPEALYDTLENTSSPMGYLAVSEESQNPPHSIEESRFLKNISGQFSDIDKAGKLVGVIHRNALKETKEEIQTYFNQLHAEQKQKEEKAQKKLLDICLHSMIDEKSKELIYPLSQEDMQALVKAMTKTAPFPSKLVLKAKKPVSMIKQKWDKLFKDGSKDNNDSLPLTSESLVEEQNRVGLGGSSLSDESKKEIWQQVLSSIHNEKPITLRQEDLEDSCRELWKKRKFSSRKVVTHILVFAGAATLFFLLPGIGAAGMLGGNILLGKFTAAEILTIFGISLLTEGVLLTDFLEKERALPILARLYVSSCESFGIEPPEKIEFKVNKRVLSLNLKPYMTSSINNRAIVHLLGESKWELNPKGWDQFDKLLSEL